MSLLIGTHYHPASPTTLRRQDRCRRSLLALKAVHLVNLQFPDCAIEVDGFETLAELQNDSCKASGREGPRKPIGDECFNLLAAAARRHGCRHFAWVNADIAVQQEAVDYILGAGRDGCVFSRADYSGVTGRRTRYFRGGQDLFAFDVNWWERERPRFRPYVNSEAYWDNVYTAIALCHGNCVLLARQEWIRHVEHPRAWRESPFAEYNERLAALDGIYYRLWEQYQDAVGDAQWLAADSAGDLEQQREFFAWPPPAGERLRQAVRSLGARVGQALQR